MARRRPSWRQVGVSAVSEALRERRLSISQAARTPTS
jgi:hypothetical protein